MRLVRGLPLISCVGVCMGELSPEPQHIFSNPPAAESFNKIPTSYESAVQARRILALTPLGTLSTAFPQKSKDVSSEESRPDVGGMPFGLMDYVADCEDSGNPTLLAIKIATSFKNVRDGSNISLAMQWTPPYPPEKRIKSTFWYRLFGREEKKEPVPYSAANLPRFSLLGYLEKIDSASTAAMSSCYVEAHPDAKYWLPGNRIHESEFMRLVVQQVYWIGGFGDRAYIGWLDVVDWKNVTRKEWESIELPGEKPGWKEWSAWGQDDL